MKVQEALKSAIEALEMASEDAKEWAMQYVTSDNAPITVRQYVADKAEPALNQLKSALAEIEKCEPVYQVWNFEVGFFEDCHLNHYNIANNDDKRILYTSPISKEWVGLSDEDIGEVLDAWEHDEKLDFANDYARAIEAKLKQLNTRG